MIYAFDFSYYRGVCKMGEARGTKAEKKIKVVFEGGVFKPLGDVKLTGGYRGLRCRDYSPP